MRSLTYTLLLLLAGSVASAQEAPANGAAPLSSPGLVMPVPLSSNVAAQYSPEARRAHYAGGTVSIQFTIDANGEPKDISVIKPLGFGLDDAAKAAVSKWRYTPGTMNGHPILLTVQVDVNFQLQESNLWVLDKASFDVSDSTQVPSVLNAAFPLPANSSQPLTVKFNVDEQGVPQNIQFLSAVKSVELQRQWEAALETWKFSPAIKENTPVKTTATFVFSFHSASTERPQIQETLPPTADGRQSSARTIPGTPAVAVLIKQTQAVYPAVAKAARVQGTVKFTATINKDGDVEELQLLSGHPLLVNAAREAVLQWKYKPTLINGNPVKVITQAVVNFTLSQ